MHFLDWDLGAYKLFIGLVYFFFAALVFWNLIVPWQQHRVFLKRWSQHHQQKLLRRDLSDCAENTQEDGKTHML